MGGFSSEKYTVWDDGGGRNWVRAYLEHVPEVIKAVEHCAELGMPRGSSARLRGIRRAAEGSGAFESKPGQMSRQSLWAACCVAARKEVRPFLGGTHLPLVPKKPGWDFLRFNALPGHPGVVGGLKAIVLRAGASALGIDARDAVGWRVEEAAVRSGSHSRESLVLSEWLQERNAVEGRLGRAKAAGRKDVSRKQSSRGALATVVARSGATRYSRPLAAELLRSHPLMRENMVRERMQLIGDVNLVDFMLKLWLLCLLDSAPEQLELDLGRQVLGSMGYRRLAAALHALLVGRPGRNVLGGDGRTPGELAEDDWQCDISMFGRPEKVGAAQGAAAKGRDDWVLEFPGFSRAMFDLIDSWVPSHSLEAFSTFFSAVLKGISSPSGDGLAEWTIVAPLSDAGIKGRATPWWPPVDEVSRGKTGSVSASMDRLRFPTLGDSWLGLGGTDGPMRPSSSTQGGRVALFTRSVVDPMLGGRGSIYPGQGVEGHHFSAQRAYEMKYRQAWASAGDFLGSDISPSDSGVLHGESSVLNCVWLHAGPSKDYSEIFGHNESHRRAKRRTPKACARDLKEVLARARLPDLA